MKMEYNHVIAFNQSMPMTGVAVNNGSGEESSPSCTALDCYPDVMFQAVALVTVVLAVSGFVGNALTILAIVTSGLRTNINSILIGNLSFADVLYTCLVLPLQAVAFQQKTWVLPGWVCVLHAAIRIWLIGVNMLQLSIIALYRYLNVVHPQLYPRMAQRPVFLPIIVVCWMFPAVFCATPVLGLWGSFSFESLILQCTFTSQAGKSHKIVVITLGYVVPCIFISFCYARIGCVVARTRKRASRGSLYRKQKNQRDSLRLTAMMLLIFLGFFLGTTPYFTINLVDPRQTKTIAHIWAPCAAWVLYSLNPVIYTLMDKNFLLAYKQLVCCLLCTQTDRRLSTGSLRQPQASSFKAPS